MTPVRPLFRDGAILGADDLTALEQLDRDRDARHARHLHTPGIATGLELATTEATTETGARYIDVTLQAGYAVDGNGRELVVGTAMPVSPDRFAGDNPNLVQDTSLDPKKGRITVWYPVFVHGLDSPLDVVSGQLGCDSASGPERMAEDVEIEFGRPGGASDPQVLPAPDAGPGDGGWRVLVGFVRLDMDSGHFVEVGTTADGVSVASAGVHAGLVAGEDGRIELRTEAAGVAGTPTIVLDAKDGGSLVFGRRKGTGEVSPLLKVDAAGNLTASGTLKGGQTSGTLLMVSGAASDGTVLPLPAGVDPAAVASGAVALSAMLTPRYPDKPPGPTLGEAAAGPVTPNPARRYLPVECRIDEHRRVHCHGTWFDAYLGTKTHVDVSSACDYILLASVPAGGAS
jgi:hypothetical protein